MGLSNWLRAVLKKSFEALRGWLADKQSGDCRTASQFSYLTRFIFDRNHFSRAKLVPKPGAFLPESSTLKTSASWKDDLSEYEIWKIGLAVGEGRGKPPRARADFDLGAISEVKLSLESDPMPDNSRHVNICGWPTAKDEQKSIAMLLSKRATLQLYEPGE
jgi:hypothetical protein